jgi:tRNA wybutosine-synthesizing protein 2
MEYCIEVKKSMAEEVKKLLIDRRIFDRKRKILAMDDWVEIPILRKDLGLGEIKGEIKEQKNPIYLKKKPIDEIMAILSNKLSKKEIKLIPTKWEKLGDVLIMKIPDAIRKKEKIISAAYAKVLRCRVVLEDCGIFGKERKPKMRHLYGDQNSETIHIENGIKFAMDPMKVMFSSGNMDERRRMAYISNANETVIDLFAGIGYFSIPMAFYSGPHIYACEINPTAFEYLKENISLNRLEDKITPLLGDCRRVAPKGIADRVIMGYLDAKNFLPTAIEALNGGGIIHYHEVCPNVLPERPIANIKMAANQLNKRAKLLNYRKVKSYSPGVSHIVIDVKINQKV